MNQPVVTQQEDMWGHGQVYIAEVVIVGGRKAAGVGETREKALLALVGWLANAGRDFDLTYVGMPPEVVENLEPQGP